jgi:hypothetical protein
VCRRASSRSDPFRVASLAVRGAQPWLASRNCGEPWGRAFPDGVLWTALRCRGGLLERAQRSPGEQSERASRGGQSARMPPGEVLWIGLRCRGEPPASTECARGEESMRRCLAHALTSQSISPASLLPPRAGVLACSARPRVARAASSRRVTMERPSGEKGPAPRRACAGGERAGVPAPSGERAAARSGPPPHREPSPPKAFRSGTPARRRRTPAGGARRSASRRPRCRRRPTDPRRSGRPRGTGWCSRRRGARRRGCGSCPARCERPRPSASRRGCTSPARARTGRMLRTTPGTWPALQPPCPSPARTCPPGAPRRRSRCGPAAVHARAFPRGHRTVSIRPQR